MAFRLSEISPQIVLTVANAALFVLRRQALCHRGHAVPRPLETVGVMNLRSYRIWRTGAGVGDTKTTGAGQRQ
jgi:hypothetical protein